MIRRDIHPGTVYLVGAGPGDPELITVRGQRLLQAADVVVYDRLVHADLVRMTPSTAKHFFVGKRPGEHTVTQADINALLLTQAREGRVVVRLKGGDPFVFGRGGEEVRRLRAGGVPFEVVPGITSAIGVPAYAGIPVTHRGVSRSFTVVTGHTCSMDDTALDWDHLASVDTLIILMGLGRLPQIAEQLVEAGRSPETPVAVIQAGTTAEQQVVQGTLRTIGGRVAHLDPPATVVVGEVARWSAALAWFDTSRQANGETFPLEGRVPPAPNAHAHTPVIPHPLRALTA